MTEPIVEPIFICSCHGEGVMVRGDEDFVYVSLWGYSDNISLKWRMKQAWAALRGKQASEVVLNFDTSKALATRLIELAEPTATPK